ncbi:MAG TPA: alpha-2-macroglobulin [Bordetella sp.]
MVVMEDAQGGTGRGGADCEPGGRRLAHPLARGLLARGFALLLAAAALTLSPVVWADDATPAETTQGDSQADDGQVSPQDSIDANPTLAASQPSGYGDQVVRGQPFFLLSDASFGSDQVAQVRLEAPGEEFQSELAAYGGADIVVYKVPDPQAFLKAQKNLHRLNIAPNYQGEGLANTLAFLWDRWLGETRHAWQRVFSYETRSRVTQAKPEFKLGEQPNAPTRFEPSNRFAPLRGYPMVSRFRYPIWDAKTIKPPKDVNLAGSSSNFITPSLGNVMIPVGKQAPGLYLVEAIIGNYRAHTLLFVSDTVAIVKSSSSGLLVWTARRDNGKPMAGSVVDWTDGVGVLQKGATGADGTLALGHVSPERSYVLGTDAAGGVFVSENFYYDSEIYNTKIYAVTDRPMYRPGDTVHVKFIGRAFQSANRSTAAVPATLALEVLDPNGAPLATRQVDFAADSGGDTRFSLPDNAPGGGYTLRFNYQGSLYGAAFRVADYVKPHFDVNLTMDKADYATGEAPKGKIALRYPDGKPVKNGKVSLTLRAQKVAIADGELRYAGLFPVKLAQQALQTDDQGNADIALPVAKDPSRYALTLFAQDGAAYRVRVTREILIARGATTYRLAADKAFSPPREPVMFNLTPAAMSGGASAGHPPATWEWLRLESRDTKRGSLPVAGPDGRLSFPVQFDAPGSYMLSVKDAAGNLLAAASHWVAGDGLKAVPGSVEIVFDHPRYRVGDTAEALITFPYPVDDALLTLERDSVEGKALLSTGGDWLDLERVAPTQWKARIKVGPGYAPNMTFSVLYVHDGEYAFQNAGIVVAKPAIDLTVASDKPVYQPGETVTLDLQSAFGGKPIAAHLTVSVVDEMVYVLQPEIAPDIAEFFYHPRRNNVRTSSSLSFITYDLALSAMRGAPGGPQRGQYNERGVKVLERPRRDEVDTAAWQADLVTDAQGRTRMQFRMPDSLARWRITVRAVSTEGDVGQRTDYIRSDKDFYLKWSGPTHFRRGDRPSVDVLAFNQSQTEKKARWVVDGAGLSVDSQVTLKPGANYLQLPRVALGDGMVDTRLEVDGKPVDRLQTPVGLVTPGWLDLRQADVALDTNAAPLALPADAQDVRVRFVSNAASRFARVMDDLIDYPYGCVEQTSSRLIPLSLAYDTLRAAGKPAGSSTQDLEARLRNQRQRLAMMAGVNGTFGWWGDLTGGNAFLTTYAYYADWLASHSLGVVLPDANWQHVLEVYRDHAAKEPLLHRALALWLLQQMGQPVGTQVSGVAEQLAKQGQRLVGQGLVSEPQDGDTLEGSLVFMAPDSDTGLEAAILLTAYTAKAGGVRLPEGYAGLAERARRALSGDTSPMIQALQAMTGDASRVSLDAVLAHSSASYSTVDRALTLLWLRKAFNGVGDAPGSLPSPREADWKAQSTPSGMSSWLWTGKNLPASLEVEGGGASAAAVVSYRSGQAQDSGLPLTIERVLYRLDPVAPQGADQGKNPGGGTSNSTDAGPGIGGGGSRDDSMGRASFQAVRVQPGDPLDSSALYVDEVRLAPQGGSILQYGLLDVPLPPGGSVEATSWGVSIAGLPGNDQGKDAQPFARAATYEMGELSYHQPIPLLAKPVVLRQLVRFAVPGTFVLPPARYFRMYQPAYKAYEGGRSDHMATLAIQ